ncbi:MAG: hypothetical protein IPI35_21625 [Deltaproteobacteria bacterium]|nr:hypothetical protein [Deltaproteobacteria bacterium]
MERIAASDWRTLQLTLADALALVQEPLHLYLENGRNDLRVCEALCQPNDRQTLSRLEDAPARLFEPGGGTGELEVRLKRLAEKPALGDVELRRLWKTWVMFGKDAGPDDATAPSAAISPPCGLV